MKNIKLNAIAIVALLCFGFGSANATTSALTLTPNGPNWDAIFGNDSVTTAFFSDFYTFIAPANNGGGGSVISGFAQFGPDVFINTFELISISSPGPAIASGAVAGFGVVDFFSFGGLISGDTYAVHVDGVLAAAGQGSGSYAGNLHIAAIPEPETYAMLLAGLGLIGFSIRRRRMV